MQTAESGTYFRVSLQDVIYEAKQYLQILDTTTDDDMLELMAWRAVKRLNAQSSLKTEVKELEVCNGEVTLPKNLFRFLWFMICGPMNRETEGGFPGGQPTTYFQNYIYVDTPFLNEMCNCGITEGEGNYPPVNYQQAVRINNGKLIFSNKRFIYFDKIRLAGIYYETDSNGVLTVNDNMVPAIVYRICSEYATVNVKKYTPEQRQLWRAQAVSMGNKVRSDDFKINFQNNIDQIQSMYRAYNYSPLVSRNRSRY
jgi:hypothetical protein